MAPLLVGLRLVPLGRALLLVWLWCLVGACVAGAWFPRAVATYFQQSQTVALGLFSAVFTLMAAPYIMAFAAAYHLFTRRYRLAIPYLTAAAWVAAELARGRLLTGSPLVIGNPWGLAGYAHAASLPLVQIASVTGIYGVSFAVICVNAAVAEVAWRLVRGEQAVTRSLGLLGLSALPALAFWAWGSTTLRRADAEPLAPATPVLLVQGNLSLGSRWHADLYGRNLDVYLDLTSRGARGGSSEIAFWPEGAMTFFLDEEPGYRKGMAAVLAPLALELVVGGPSKQGDDPPVYYNSIFVIEPDGATFARYDKEYLLPFAEYFPWQIDLLRRRFGRIREFAHGVQTAPVPTRAGLAGVLVCNEVMLPEVAAQRVAAGARYLLNPSNDTWIRDPQYVEQQFDIARMRAIEERRYLVRVSTTGPSAVIDPWGRVRARTQTGVREFVHGELRAREDLSFYARHGDVFALACAALALVAAGLSALRHRMRRDGLGNAPPGAA